MPNSQQANAKGGRPRKHVDLVDLIGRRWSGQSFREIARQTGLGLGTVVRAHRQAMERVAAFQNPKADEIPANVSGAGNA